MSGPSTTILVSCCKKWLLPTLFLFLSVLVIPACGRLSWPAICSTFGRMIKWLIDWPLGNGLFPSQLLHFQFRGFTLRQLCCILALMFGYKHTATSWWLYMSGAPAKHLVHWSCQWLPVHHQYRYYNKVKQLWHHFIVKINWHKLWFYVENEMTLQIWRRSDQRL